MLYYDKNVKDKVLYTLDFLKSYLDAKDTILKYPKIINEKIDNFFDDSYRSYFIIKDTIDEESCWYNTDYINFILGDAGFVDYSKSQRAVWSDAEELVCINLEYCEDLFYYIVNNNQKLDTRINNFKKNKKSFSKKDYINLIKDISKVSDNADLPLEEAGIVMKINNKLVREILNTNDENIINSLIKRIEEINASMYITESYNLLYYHKIKSLIYKNSLFIVINEYYIQDPELLDLSTEIFAVIADYYIEIFNIQKEE